jgi:hypothetical protein
MPGANPFSIDLAESTEGHSTSQIKIGRLFSARVQRRIAHRTELSFAIVMPAVIAKKSGAEAPQIFGFDSICS